jgi:hypothetical protein
MFRDVWVVIGGIGKGFDRDLRMQRESIWLWAGKFGYGSLEWCFSCVDDAV